MKAALVVILFAASAFAQDQSAIAAAEAACGPKNVNFALNRTPPSTRRPNPSPAKPWSM